MKSRLKQAVTLLKDKGFEDMASSLKDNFKEGMYVGEDLIVGENIAIRDDGKVYKKRDMDWGCTLNSHKKGDVYGGSKL